MKEKILFNWIIPVLKLALFVIFYDTVVFLLFGEHLTYDEIDIQKKPRKRVSYRSYYSKRRSDDDF